MEHRPDFESGGPYIKLFIMKIKRFVHKLGNSGVPIYLMHSPAGGYKGPRCLMPLQLEDTGPLAPALVLTKDAILDQQGTNADHMTNL